MTTIASAKKITFDEFANSPDFKGFELVGGRLVEKNMSNLSSVVGNEVGAELRRFVKEHRLGIVLNCEAMYRCFPDPNTGRKPDVSFIRNEQLPADWAEQSHFTVAPDLVVEVISPSDLAYEVDRKVRQYLKAGVPLVWVINPEIRVARVHRADNTTRNVEENELFEGEGVLSGFSCPLSAMLP